MKILLLEDDFMLNEAIDKYLTSVGHAVIAVKDGKECLELIYNNKYDLFVFDINVPNIDGFEILEKLREMKITVPTIFISALIGIEDITRAFDMGCYDYLKKPFHLQELTLRINKLLRTTQVPLEHKRLSKSYSYDSRNMVLLFNNEPHILPKRQLQIIDLLSANRGRVVAYEMFRDYVWNDYEIDNGTIRAEVNRVRKILKEDFIITIRGIGYMIDIPN